MTQWIRGVVCRVVGHCWGWPELYFTVDSVRPGVQVVMLRHVWRECGRCGCRVVDEDKGTTCAVLPSFEGLVLGLRPRGEEDAFGEQVKRAMGWNN